MCVSHAEATFQRLNELKTAVEEERGDHEEMIVDPYAVNTIEDVVMVVAGEGANVGAADLGVVVAAGEERRGDEEMYAAPDGGGHEEMYIAPEAVNTIEDGGAHGIVGVSDTEIGDGQLSDMKVVKKVVKKKVEKKKVPVKATATATSRRLRSEDVQVGGENVERIVRGVGGVNLSSTSRSVGRRR